MEDLDLDFDKLLTELKPYVLNLHDIKEKEKCTLWIKKLCELYCFNDDERRNRNAYAKLMKSMLEKDIIQSPFDVKPTDGILPILSPKTSSINGVGSTNLKPLPDWISSNLSTVPIDESSPVAKRLSHVRGMFKSAVNPPEYKDSTYSSKPESLDFNKRLYVSTVDRKVSPDISRYSSYIIGDSENLVKACERELEMKIKVMEAQFYEERLRMQQQHDEAIQKILNRKNTEFEELKQNHRAKLKELEAEMSKLERKNTAMVKEVAVVRDSKDKQLEELKKMVEKSSETYKHEYEKKLNDALANFEKEKFEIQKQHTVDMQELLENTNTRLKRMENDYSQQVSSMSGTITEMDSRIHTLTEEAETLTASRNELNKRLLELEMACERQSRDLKDWNVRYSNLEVECQHIKDEKEEEFRSLKEQCHTELELKTQEHKLALGKCDEQIHFLESKLGIDLLEQKGFESEANFLREKQKIQDDLKKNFNLAKTEYEQTIAKMKSKFEFEVSTLTEKKVSSEKSLSDQKMQYQSLLEKSQQQSKEAEKTIKELKNEMEETSGKMASELKEKIVVLEKELSECREKMKKQNDEHKQQLANEKMKNEKQLNEMKSSLEKNFKTSMDRLKEQKGAELQIRNKELANHKADSTHQISLLERKLNFTDESLKRCESQNSQLHAELASLKNQLKILNETRENELEDLARSHDEELDMLKKDYESTLLNFRNDSERQIQELQKLHSMELEETMDKMNAQFRTMEKEHSDKLAKQKNTIDELKASLSKTRDELDSKRDYMEKQVNELSSNFAQEKEVLSEKHKSILTSLRKSLNDEQARSLALRKELEELKFSHTEQMNNLELNFEEKLGSMLPVGIRSELESTIEALRKQIGSLEQSLKYVREELELKNKIIALNSND